MFQGKGLYICFVNKLDFWGSQYLKYIQVDNLYTDLLDIRVNMNKRHYYTERLNHMEMDCKDPKIELVRWLNRNWNFNLEFSLIL